MICLKSQNHLCKSTSWAKPKNFQWPKSTKFVKFTNRKWKQPLLKSTPESKLQGASISRTHIYQRRGSTLLRSLFLIFWTWRKLHWITLVWKMSKPLIFSKPFKVYQEFRKSTSVETKSELSQSGKWGTKTWNTGLKESKWPKWRVNSWPRESNAYRNTRIWSIWTSLVTMFRCSQPRLSAHYLAQDLLWKP